MSRCPLGVFRFYSALVAWTSRLLLRSVYLLADDSDGRPSFFNAAHPGNVTPNSTPAAAAASYPAAVGSGLHSPWIADAKPSLALTEHPSNNGSSSSNWFPSAFNRTTSDYNHHYHHQPLLNRHHRQHHHSRSSSGDVSCSATGLPLPAPSSSSATGVFAPYQQSIEREGAGECADVTDLMTNDAIGRPSCAGSLTSFNHPNAAIPGHNGIQGHSPYDRYIISSPQPPPPSHPTSSRFVGGGVAKTVDSPPHDEQPCDSITLSPMGRAPGLFGRSSAGARSDFSSPDTKLSRSYYSGHMTSSMTGGDRLRYSPQAFGGMAPVSGFGAGSHPGARNHHQHPTPSAYPPPPPSAYMNYPPTGLFHPASLFKTGRIRTKSRSSSGKRCYSGIRCLEGYCKSIDSC